MQHVQNNAFFRYFLYWIAMRQSIVLTQCVIMHEVYTFFLASVYNGLDFIVSSEASYNVINVLEYSS